jgi:hypothetical protein
MDFLTNLWTLFQQTIYLYGLWNNKKKGIMIYKDLEYGEWLFN